MYIVFRRIFLIIFVASSVAYTLYGDDNDNGNDFEAFVDNTQNPCKNFYGFACGNWQRTLKETREKFRDLEGYLNLQYVDLLATGFEKRMQAQITADTHGIYKKAQDYYASCRKTLNLEVYQYVNILKAKHEDLNWLDILHNSNVTLTEQNWNWLKVLGRLHSYGFNNALMSMSVVRINATSSVIKFSRPESTEFTGVEQLALEPLDPVLKSNIISFKQQLEYAGRDQVAVKSEYINLADLTENFIGKNIRNYLVMLPNSLQYEKLEFQVEDVNYVRALQKLISETPQSVVAYFVGLKFVSYLRAEMPKGTEPADCLSPIKEQIPELLNFIYAEQFYDKQRVENDKIIDQVFRNLKVAYLEILSEHSTNLDHAALQFVQEKLTSMQLNVGQILLGIGIDFYDNYTIDLEIGTNTFGSFYHNHLNLMSFRISKELELLNLPAYEPEYIFYLYRKAPCFDKYANLVIYPFSLLQKPIFDTEYDELLHYAGLASIMAHDMTHAFDRNGLKYDSQGNHKEMFEKILNNNVHFQKALKCLQKYPTSRLNEKIADFVGSRVAYNAYFKNTHETKDLNTTLNMTRKQIFFVKFAQFYCVTDMQQSNEKSMLSQIVENNEEFFDAFNCEKPKNYETCSFW